MIGDGFIQPASPPQVIFTLMGYDVESATAAVDSGAADERGERQDGGGAWRPHRKQPNIGI